MSEWKVVCPYLFWGRKDKGTGYNQGFFKGYKEFWGIHSLHVNRGNRGTLEMRFINDVDVMKSIGTNMGKITKLKSEVLLSFLLYIKVPEAFNR